MIGLLQSSYVILRGMVVFHVKDVYKSDAQVPNCRRVFCGSSVILYIIVVCEGRYIKQFRKLTTPQ